MGRAWLSRGDCVTVAPRAGRNREVRILCDRRGDNRSPRPFADVDQVHPSLGKKRRKSKTGLNHGPSANHMINQERLKNLLIELIRIDSLSRREQAMAIR